MCCCNTTQQVLQYSNANGCNTTQRFNGIEAILNMKTENILGVVAILERDSMA